MLIRGVSIARINPPIYRRALLDFAHHLCVIILAVCMVMPQLFNTLLIKTAGGELISLNFLISVVPPAWLALTLPFTLYLLSAGRACSHSARTVPFTKGKSYKHNAHFYLFRFLLFLLFTCLFYFATHHSGWCSPRLLRPLHLGLSVLRVPDALQHGGGAGLVRRLHVGGMLLLLLLRRPRRRLQQPLRHGLWHHGRLLRVLGLPGDLHGVLRHLLPHIGRGRPALRSSRVQGW